MRVFVKVQGAEAFPIQVVRTREELERVLDFARIGSQTGAPRRVFKILPNGRALLIARYVDGESRTTVVMRARRSPLWGLAGAVLFGAVKKVTRH